jgi:probable F420-dependent oxidoreductase|tara:strand:+ start:1594 stop:2550 length:957 start_codon:yes stop_codon:yes gene_type:complete
MLAKGAEAQGQEGVFAAQVWGPPFTSLAAAAAVTERIKIASGIAIAAARSPFETAMTAIDLDRISSGRFVLGLGASVEAITTGFFGAPKIKPVTHLRETVSAVRHVIAGAHKGLEPFSGEYYSGDYSFLDKQEPPVREEIPIWIAALRPRLVELGGEIAEGVMGHPIWSVDWAVNKIQPALARGLKKAGRNREDVDLNLWFWCAPNPDEKESLQDAKGTVAFYAAAEQYHSFFEAHGFGREAGQLQAAAIKDMDADRTHLVPDDMAQTFVLCGRPDAVKAQIEEAWTVADSMALNPPSWGMSLEKRLFYMGEIAKLST